VKLANKSRASSISNDNRAFFARLEWMGLLFRNAVRVFLSHMRKNLQGAGYRARKSVRLVTTFLGI